MSTVDSPQPGAEKLEADVRDALVGDPTKSGAVGPLQEYGEALASGDPERVAAAHDAIAKAVAARLARPMQPQPSP